MDTSFDPLDLVDDAPEIVDLTAVNKAEVMGAYRDHTILSAVADKPACRVWLQSASFARIQQFSKVAGSDDAAVQLRALCALIAESVVEPGGAPVWSGAEILEMAKGCTKRFMALQVAVLQHNGLKVPGRLDDMIEDAAKN